ncbi:hypothetical protein RHMOL_Rhmol01G0163500 [Rhododendron molle]|uniref:Uncharacterized protein n=1 Tax=Rhododendron molle TaxID=49168 RepID=A0ACC0Q1Z4_RHOML|nr:hypothetical protein RHMOL_Rhmol01G0163500 [Rhododendron molle]
MAKCVQFKAYLKKEPTTEQEVEQMARAYLLYLFGASVYPSRCNRVYLSYLTVLRDPRKASRFDWGRAALGTVYGFLGDASRTEQVAAGYWRIWELWAYEVLNMYCLQTRCPDLSTLPYVLILSKDNMGEKKGRGDLNVYRLYLDELKASRVGSLERDRARAIALGQEQGCHGEQSAAGVGLWLAVVLGRSSGTTVTWFA